MSSESISIYVNPRASQTRLRDLESEFRKTFFRHQLLIKAPPTLEDLALELRKDVAAGVETIACVGGDGTINQVLKGVHPSATKLLVIPSGTANDIAKICRASPRVEKSKRLIQYQTVKQVDVLDVNGVPFVTHGGLGVGARLCELVNSKRQSSASFLKLMQKFREESYGISLVSQLLTQKMPTYTINLRAPHLPAEGISVTSPMILISNTPSIAGRLGIAPYTQESDGKFCVSVFLTRTNAEFFAQFARLRFSKMLHDSKKFLQFETESLTAEITSGESIPFFGDGDILLSASKFEIGVREEKQSFYYDDPNHVYSSSYPLEGVPTL